MKPNILNKVMELLNIENDTFIERWYGRERYVYHYNDSYLRCISHEQGYACDYIVIGELLEDESYVKVMGKKGKTENQKAIECLEDVRDSILDISNGWWKCFKDGNQYMTSTDLQGCIEEIIEQKIGKLKGE